MNNSSHEVEILGSRTKYWIYNPDQKRTILAIHGFRGNHNGLKYILAGLEDFRIVIPDLPGFGESQPMPSHRHDVDGYSDFVVEFTSKLGLAGSTLLGHSFGTIVAGHVVAEHPHLFSRLILINPIAISPRNGIIQAPFTKLTEAYYWLGTHLPESAGQRVIKSKAFNLITSLTLISTTDRKLVKRVYSHHLSDLKLPHHRTVIAESFEASIKKTVLDDAARITLPTLMIAGEKDAMVPASRQRKLHAKLPNARLILIPKVGHLIHLETPEVASSAIADFLNAASPTA